MRHTHWIWLLMFTAARADHLSDVSAEAGVQFTHHNGHSGVFQYPEIVGSGVALFDFDNDGDLDIYWVQSGEFSGNRRSDELWINRLDRGAFQFERFAGLTGMTRYGIGVASADVNRDGYIDLLVTGIDGNQLLINQQGRGFQVSDLPWDGPPRFAASATFCDVNNDGWPDAFVVNYVDWRRDKNPTCYAKTSARDYCGPDAFAGQADVFYLNQGDGQFKEATEAFFPDMPAAPGLGVVCRDLDNDGYADLVVANDGKANQLWSNRAGQGFVDRGLISGVAVNGAGIPEASMGIAAEDFDLDGDVDLLFTHLMGETNTLLSNSGRLFFNDVTQRSGLAASSFSRTAWATGFLDLNSDEWPDLLVFNGAVASLDAQGGVAGSLQQHNDLYVQTARGQFRADDSDAWLRRADVSRGAAFGDLDNDGDVDVVLSNNHGAGVILRNNLNPTAWWGLTVDATRCPRARLLGPQDAVRALPIHSDGSYASANDTRLRVQGAALKRHDRLQLECLNTAQKTFTLSASNRYEAHTP